MKQFLALVTAGLMTLVLSGCGEDKSKQPEATAEPAAVEQPAATTTEEAKPAEGMKMEEPAKPAEEQQQ